MIQPLFSLDCKRDLSPFNEKWVWYKTNEQAKPRTEWVVDQGPLQMTPFFFTCTCLKLLMQIFLSFLNYSREYFHDTVPCADLVLPLSALLCLSTFTVLVHSLISQMCILQSSAFLYAYSLSHHFKCIKMSMTPQIFILVQICSYILFIFTFLLIFNICFFTSIQWLLK